MIQNRNISPDILRENYKKDKRKPMSLRAHTKLNAVTAMFAGSLFFWSMVSSDVINGKENPADIAIFIILGLGMFISGFIWCMNLTSYKLEPDDEMSEQLRGKANGMAFIVWFPLALSVFSLLEHFHPGATSAIMKISNTNSYMLLISGILTYDSIRHFLFLMMDKDDKSSEKEE
ncbi:hypothetical protein [Ruminococcus albus]|uniref:Uncharacterized protein n=1 Tax=Ruminococcus albus (strain ATCC 27210 / DSM 20455 / JCM 14654 / NCDO 2250 / 7) TaxID=697329 RepID=E6UDS5_RUMA7|nr:hypothetical protein [Ruminococcus albus]ADU20903.1 hypothetical protein Rumal_0346 [Ruminococcus albus 7 = DSM 20455]